MGGGSAMPIVALCSRRSKRLITLVRAYLRVSLSSLSKSLSLRAPSNSLPWWFPSPRCVYGPSLVCLITTPPSNCPTTYCHTHTTTAHLHTHSHPIPSYSVPSVVHDTRLAFRCLLFTHTSSPHCPPASPPQLLTHSPPAHTRGPALIRRAQHSETSPAANPAVPVHSRGVCTHTRPLILTCIFCIFHNPLLRSATLLPVPLCHTPRAPTGNRSLARSLR